MPEEERYFNSEAFLNELDSALLAEKVFDISSYGWLNADDTDPDFIGHAMWQIDQPSIDYKALMGESPVQSRPNELDKEILTAGEDFCGLMQASRISIGMALVWHRKAVLDLMNENAFFWNHHTDTFLKLEIASDRLRKILIVSCTGNPSRNFKHFAEQRAWKDWYTTPFIHAGLLLQERGIVDERIAEPLMAILDLSNEIYNFIAQRNKVVHEIATRIARSTQKSLSNLQHLHDRQKRLGFSPKRPDLCSWVPTGEDWSEERRRELDVAKEELIRWYNILVQASSQVFQIEYWSRQLSRQKR